MHGGGEYNAIIGFDLRVEGSHYGPSSCGIDASNQVGESSLVPLTSIEGRRVIHAADKMKTDSSHVLEVAVFERRFYILRSGYGRSVFYGGLIGEQYPPIVALPVDWVFHDIAQPEASLFWVVNPANSKFHPQANVLGHGVPHISHCDLKRHNAPPFIKNEGRRGNNIDANPGTVRQFKFFLSDFGLPYCLLGQPLSVSSSSLHQSYLPLGCVHLLRSLFNYFVCLPPGIFHLSKLSLHSSQLPLHDSGLHSDCSKGSVSRAYTQDSDDQQDGRERQAQLIHPVTSYRHGGKFGDSYGFLSVVVGIGFACVLVWLGADYLDGGQRTLGWVLIAFGSPFDIMAIGSVGVGHLPWDWWHCLNDGQDHSEYERLHVLQYCNTQKDLTSPNYRNTGIAVGRISVMENVLSADKQAMIIGALAEGSSIRSIERMTGVHRDTIIRLGVEVGDLESRRFGKALSRSLTLRDTPQPLEFMRGRTTLMSQIAHGVTSPYCISTRSNPQETR
jgi:hypothetical protein